MTKPGTQRSGPLKEAIQGVVSVLEGTLGDSIALTSLNSSFSQLTPDLSRFFFFLTPKPHTCSCPNRASSGPQAGETPEEALPVRTTDSAMRN